MSKAYPDGCYYLSHMEARRSKSDAWQNFTGIRKTKEKILMSFYKKHIKEFFSKMDYQYSVVVRKVNIDEKGAPATRTIIP